MKNAALLFVLALSVTPAHAEDDTNLRDGMDLLSQGTQLLLRGLMGEIEPALRELESALGELHAYHPPEVLPNGDIIIRRKVPNEPVPDPETGEIDL